MYILHFILVALATFCPGCISFHFTFTEGELAELRYVYSSEEHLNIQLRMGENEPFFQNRRKVANMLTASQYKRFKIKISPVSPGQSNGQIVQLQIQNISRTDAGEYTCEVIRDGNVAEHMTQKFSVSIEYPLGRASCIMNRVKKVHFGINGIWEMMNCSAVTGTDPGYISCFQNNEQSPPWTIPISNQTHTLQKIWVREDLPVVCCSSTYRLPKTQCECNDFVWSPDNTLEINSCSDSSTTASFYKSSKHESRVIGERANGVTQDAHTFTHKYTDTENGKQAMSGEGEGIILSISLIIVTCLIFLVNLIFLIFLLYSFQRVENRLASEMKDIKKSIDEMHKRTMKE